MLAETNYKSMCWNSDDKQEGHDQARAVSSQTRPKDRHDQAGNGSCKGGGDRCGCELHGSDLRMVNGLWVAAAADTTKCMTVFARPNA